MHTRPVDKLLALLSTTLDRGLEPGEARERQKRHGANVIQGRVRRGPWTLVREQFTDVMILVLIAAAVLAGFIGEPQDSVAIAAIVILNAVLGFAQAYRAERALLALKSLAAPTATVRRAGQIATVPAADLVPGDVILLEAGNIVPADVRIAESQGLTIDESVLTGESQPVGKTADALPADDLPLGDRRNLAYKGTTVTYGRGLGLVVATGGDTELGRIAALLRESDSARTPLQKRLDLMGRRLALAAVGICAIVFAVGILRGEPAGLMLLTAISLAVAAVPEALPAVVTVALAIGARRMIRRQALIRHLPAVETLGSVTYICADKTGTITENRMRAAAFWVDGVLIDDARPGEPPENAPFWQALALCNDAHRDETGAWRGDPTEVALVEAAERAGFDCDDLARSLPRVDEVPFSSERGLMTTVHRGREGVISFSKGAPEQVLDRCDWTLTRGRRIPWARASAVAQADRLAAKGQRVLAIACRRWPDAPDPRPASAELEQDLTFLGLVGLADPPRQEAAGAVALCRQAGITPIMITGDHPSTAAAIARQVGILGEGDRILTGLELQQLEPEPLAKAVGETRLYARVAPEQKIAIVEALQARREFVAMTGDGVNDAPAIKRADIGIAMGRSGTDVAREAADMVLLDDNFATIVSAVREGRRIFDNIRKFVRYVLTGNAAEIWTLLLAPLIGLPTPLLPIQILWINLVTDGLPGLALALEPEEPSVMRRRPRPPDETVFAHGLWQHILWVGLLMAGVTLAAGAVGYRSGSSHWQSMVFTVLTLSQLLLALAVRSERESLFRQGLGSNPVLFAVVLGTAGVHLLTLYVPALNDVFATTALTAGELLLCFALAASVFAAVEIGKWRGRSRLPS